MNQLDELNNIKKYLGRFENEVSFSNSNNEYDINIHSENVLIPILNLLFDVNLVNLNYKIKNNKTFDLGDNSKQIAFQITSENSSTKLKEVVHSFKSNIAGESFRTCVIIILGKKKRYQEHTKKDVSSMSGKKFEETVFDLYDLYRLISSKESDKISNIEKILSGQFLDQPVDQKLKFRNDSSIYKLDIIDSDSNIINQRYFLKEGDNTFYCQATYTDGHVERYNPHRLTWSEDAIRLNNPTMHFGKQKQESISIRCKPNHEMYFEISCWVSLPSKDGDPSKAIELIYPDEYPPLSNCSVSVFLHSSKTSPKIEIWNRGKQSVKNFELKIDDQKYDKFVDENNLDVDISQLLHSKQKVFIVNIPVVRQIKVESSYLCVESNIGHSGTRNLINYAINK